MHYEIRLRHIVDLGLPPYPLAVLLALNRYAHHKTHQCNPSLDTLAGSAVMHKITVHRILHELAKAGHIRIKSGERQHTSSTYTVLPRMLDVSAKQTSEVSVGLTEPTTTTGNILRPRKYTKKDYAERPPEDWCQRCRMAPNVGDHGLCFTCYAKERREVNR